MPPNERLLEPRRPDLVADSAYVSPREFLLMKKTQVALAILVATGLATSPFAAQAKHKAKHHHSSMSSKKSGSAAANPSSEGNVGPGTSQAGSKNTGAK